VGGGGGAPGGCAGRAFDAVDALGVERDVSPVRLTKGALRPYSPDDAGGAERCPPDDAGGAERCPPDDAGGADWEPRRDAPSDGVVS